VNLGGKECYETDELATALSRAVGAIIQLY
jgi:hypothetical protein